MVPVRPIRPIDVHLEQVAIDVLAEAGVVIHPSTHVFRGGTAITDLQRVMKITLLDLDLLQLLRSILAADLGESERQLIRILYLAGLTKGDVDRVLLTREAKNNS